MSEEKEILVWSWASEDTVVPSTQAVAVYLTSYGDVVVRRAAWEWEKEDVSIVIPRRYARLFIERMERLLTQSSTKGGEPKSE